MNFLDKFVIPLGAGHIELLNIIQIITLIIFLPYTGMILGGTAISIYFNGKGKKENNPLYTRFAKDIIERLQARTVMGIGFTVLPVATLSIIYSQILFSAKIITVSFLIFSVLYYLASVIFISKYKNSFLKNPKPNKYLVYFRLVREEDWKEDEAKNIVPSLSGYAYLGLTAMLVGLFLLVCGTTVVSDPTRWNTTGIIKSVFSPHAWFNLLYLIFASVSISGGAILYLFFIWQGGIKDMNDEYKKLVKGSVIPVTMISLMIQPIFLFGSTVLTPVSAMSSSVYIYIVFSLAGILVTGNLLYAIYKNSEIRFAGAVFFIMFLVFAFTVVKEQVILGNSVKEHIYTLSQKSEGYSKQRKSVINTDAKIDAEQIFNQKCFACHKFDEKFVGPSYKETVPKYNGDAVKLAEYIYNPVKINPEYTVMPSQGLKREEAEALAKWLIEKTK